MRQKLARRLHGALGKFKGWLNMLRAAPLKSILAKIIPKSSLESYFCFIVTVHRDRDDTRTFRFWMIFDEKSSKR
ncbi:MAG: hypothetical protein A2103_00605 [Gammaproteobacteria bacterium GWF2_41_13]|nr:MAG: hypothetical protein A2103_00605 [Gammaproteobacteria bacterium GWF2_41_13]